MTATLTPTSRAALLDELETTHFDLIVIGGGIAGAGIAREAAARGLRVALCEAGDFGIGTSSRSSKLIHGGLRYLAQGRVDFVRRTTQERAGVHAMAPHLARPCWMVTPARDQLHALVIRSALTVYERLGGIGRGDTHIGWDRDELAEREPALRLDTHGLAIAHREYLTDDIRLVLAVLRAAARSGATLASRVPVRGFLRRGRRIEGVVVHCGASDREIQVRGAVVVNAAGPWVGRLAKLEAEPPAANVVFSKGVHVVVDRDRLPVKHPILYTASDRRWIYMVPRGPVVYIGTTDTPYEGARVTWPPIDRADVDYLLAPLAGYLAAPPPTADDVIAAWAGLRALPVHHVRKVTAMSREAELCVGPGMLLSVAGGKLTGFAGLATSTVEAAGRLLDRELPPGPGTEPLPGAAPEPIVDDERLHHLYGSDALAVMALGPDLLVDGAPVLVGEVDWAVGVEAASTVEDVIYRRTLAAWFQPRHRVALAGAVADRMTTLLGWSPQRREEELCVLHQRFAAELSFRSSSATRCRWS